MGISSDTNSQPVTLTIAGMHCGNCVARVARALTALDGVEVESLSIGKAVAQINVSKVKADDLVAAVARAGYTAVPEGS